MSLKYTVPGSKCRLQGLQCSVKMKCKVECLRCKVHGSKCSAVHIYLYVALFIDEYVARLPGEQEGTERKINI